MRNISLSRVVELGFGDGLMSGYEGSLREFTLRVYKWPGLGDVPIWYFRDHAGDVCTKCMYTYSV